MLCFVRNIATINAKPTATSAAATVMTKKTKTCPFKVSCNREKATKADQYSYGTNREQDSGKHKVIRNWHVQKLLLIITSASLRYLLKM
jgi:hypothetical protein